MGLFYWIKRFFIKLIPIRIGVAIIRGDTCIRDDTRSGPRNV